MITVKINTIDRSNLIDWESLSVTQKITNQVDSAKFTIRKYGTRTYTPTVGDAIEILDGTAKIFAGTILDWNERVEASKGVVYDIDCVDWTFLFDSKLVSKSYESQTIKQIIDDIITNFTDGSFTSNNVDSSFLIDKIVFNQIPPSVCVKRLANILKYDWYIDEDKDIHFFSKFTNLAPFNLTDSSGNYVYKSLQRKIDGSQLSNVVLVRGGEYNAATYTDIITVKGNDSKSFELPYKFDNIAIDIDIGAGWVSQQIGIDFIDDFGASVDVLYNYQEKTIRFQSALTDTNKIRFSGNPKVPVLAIAEDTASKLEFGEKRKLIRDTSIEDLQTARRRAIAELQTYADEVEDGKFDTYINGLRAGMVINLTSTVRGANTDFIIHTLTAKVLDPNTFVYTVSVVTTRKYNLIDLLRQLLEPEPMQADESEVAEIIKTDIVTVTITELIEAVSAVTDINSLTITENIAKDPLGAGIAPTWVVGYYTPTGVADTKRHGLLNRTMQVY